MVMETEGTGRGWALKGKVGVTRGGFGVTLVVRRVTG
jgi:hypothetical protein